MDGPSAGASGRATVHGMRGAGIVGWLGIATACSSGNWSGNDCVEVPPRGPPTFDSGVVLLRRVPVTDAGLLSDCAYRDGVPVGAFTELPATDPLCATACSDYKQRCRVWPACRTGDGADTLVQCQDPQGGGFYAC